MDVSRSQCAKWCMVGVWMLSLPIVNADELQTAVSVQYNAPKVIHQSSNDHATVTSRDIRAYGRGQDADISNTTHISTGALGFYQDPSFYGSGYYDAESGLQYMGARYYSPKLAVFIAQDGYNLMNRYRYANGNPIMYIDPDGHLSAGTWALIIGAGVASIMSLGNALGASSLFLRAAFIVGNVAPPGVQVLSDVMSGRKTDAIGDGTIMAAAFFGVWSAQPGLWVEKGVARAAEGETMEQAETRTEEAYKESMKKFKGREAKYSSWVSQGLMGAGVGFKSQGKDRSMMVASSFAFGMLGGGFYGEMTPLLKEGKHGWNAFVGSMRTGFTGLIASVPAVVEQIQHANWNTSFSVIFAVEHFVPFAMGGFSGFSQEGYDSSMKNGTFWQKFGWSSARMGYLFVKPPLWGAATSGNFSDYFTRPFY